MLRIIGFLAFMIGLVSFFESDSNYSIIFITAGATLLFSPQPSAFTLSFGVLCFCVIYLLRNGFDPLAFFGVLCGFACIGGFHWCFNCVGIEISFGNSDGDSCGDGGDGGGGGD